MHKITKKDKILLQDIREILPPREQEHFDTFSHRILHTLLKSTAKNVSDYLKYSLHHSWNLFYKRSLSEKINFHYLDRAEGATVVTVLNDDRSFLLDSSIYALKHQGFFPTFIIHPVFAVQRGSDGILTDLHARPILGKSLKKKYLYESFITLYFEQELSSAEQHTIQTTLEATFKNVSIVVDNWDVFKKKCSDLKPLLSSEETDFIQWILSENFIFLSYQQYDQKIQCIFSLGIDTPLPVSGYYTHLQEQRQQQIFQHNSAVYVQKTSVLSPVHKAEFLDLVHVVFYDSKGAVEQLHQFWGLFTSASLARPIKEVPLLRQKALQIFEDSDLQPQWHDGKVLSQLLQTFPRSAFFNLSLGVISPFISKILDQQNKKHAQLYVFSNDFYQTFSCLIYLPVDQFSPHLKQQIIGQFHLFFPNAPITLATSINENEWIWLHFVIAYLPTSALPDLKMMEKSLYNLLQGWQDILHTKLKSAYPIKEAEKIFAQFSNAFDFAYQQRFGHARLLDDIAHIQKVRSDFSQKSSVAFDWHPIEKDNRFYLFIYHVRTPIALSTILPILENMGLKTISEYSFVVNPVSDPVFLQVLDISSHTIFREEIDSLKERLLDTLQRVWQETVENDGFNKLILQAGLTANEAIIFRAYAKYLRQIRFLYPQSSIENVLSNYPDIIQSFIHLFHQRFDPALATQKVSKNFLAVLKKKISLVPYDDEYILNSYLKLIMFTLRTNYFQHIQTLYLAFKIDSKKIDFLPLPRPHCEIYVYAVDMEAIHLRGGNVARGGIRWSDRQEDFRTEVLGLLKAQMTKNAVIVPTGSKGGFIIKPTKNPLTGAQAYQKMMKALLSLTDNFVQENPVYPEKIHCIDGFDPYLVVAADKGTASFSDLANTISKDHHFWLGDAFASGGSQGYDHKKLGITAKGAWESVKRHFHSLGHQISTTPFSVIAVGDMAGDVFGNGMLQSDKIKLMGAFNHKHIFVDPFPDPAISFKERHRMFHLPTSTWTDYDLKQASNGAAVFDRSQKVLHLSKEIRQAFGITTEDITPTDLIKRLLSFPVDLLWFGGIGTFIKSTKETSMDVNDKTNDAIRINGQDLRCRVLVEGANLGITQPGRVEYALKGGFIYTDFIDNSGGVNCSDHEVNLKILLDKFIERQILSVDARDPLLKQMTSEITALVLQSNVAQASSLHVYMSSAAEDLKNHLKLIKQFEDRGKINRLVENIPEDLLLIQRTGVKGRKGLTTPELAVLMAYTKNILKEELLVNFPITDPRFDPIFYSYFPLSLRQKYQQFLNLHPLKKEITINVLVNLIVNTMGCTFAQEFSDQNISLIDIVYSFLFIYTLCPLQDLWDILHITDMEEDVHILVYQDIQKWTQHYCRLLLTDPELYALLKKPESIPLLGQLSPLVAEFFKEEQRFIFPKNTRRFIRKKIPESVNQRLQELSYFSYCFDLLPIVSATQMPPNLVVIAYSMLTEICGFYWLYNKAYDVPIENKWQNQALTDLIQDIRSLQQKMVIQFLQQSLPKTLDDVEQAVNHWYDKKAIHLQQIIALIDEIKTVHTFDFSLLAVVVRQLKKIMV